MKFKQIYWKETDVREVMNGKTRSGTDMVIWKKTQKSASHPEVSSGIFRMSSSSTLEKFEPSKGFLMWGTIGAEKRFRRFLLQKFCIMSGSLSIRDGNEPTGFRVLDRNIYSRVYLVGQRLNCMSSSIRFKMIFAF